MIQYCIHTRYVRPPVRRCNNLLCGSSLWDYTKREGETPANQKKKKKKKRKKKTGQKKKKKKKKECYPIIDHFNYDQ